MLLKYGRLIEGLLNCPPAACRSMNITGYRFVFEDLNHRNNYMPPLVIHPQRVNSPKFSTDARKCEGYALSMFDGLDKAKRKYAKLARDFRNIERTIGCHIAEFVIEEKDGLVSTANSEGHFDLHEFEETTFLDRVRLVCPAM